MSNSKAQFLFRLDVALFVATASALAGYYRYQQRRPVRRASTRLHVSFGVTGNDENAAKKSDATTVPAVVSLSLLEELHVSSSSSSSSKTRPILGLLFAASWCPDCNDAGSGVVSAVGRVAAEHSRTVLDFVYVSSDTSEAELLQFKPQSMRHVPFDNVELRTALKRQFRTCASREVGDVLVSGGGHVLQRVHGIPTLILLDTATGTVLTTNGVEDVMNAESPSQVLQKWKSMLEEQETGN